VTGIRPGLCSVTLRASSVDAVARLAGECGLAAIEWGADVHVPPGDARAAATARTASDAADIEVASYGSYLVAAGLPDPDERTAVLDTAGALGAPNVRVWGGFGVVPDTDGYAALVDGLTTFAHDAATRGLTVGVEYHGGTVTSTLAGTLALLDAVGAANLASYWQPPYWRGPTAPDADAAEVTALGSRLSHLHLEGAGPDVRRPLPELVDRWQAVLAAAIALGGDRVAFLEFVTDDDPDALRRDAATLRSWLRRRDARPADADD
jgi:sugar phosphate isomerase/epimerase